VKRIANRQAIIVYGINRKARQYRRAVLNIGAFIFSALTVARPVIVKPRKRVQSGLQQKC